MKIQYCSDLHLEFAHNERFLKEIPIQPVADILVWPVTSSIGNKRILSIGSLITFLTILRPFTTSQATMSFIPAKKFKS